MFYEKNIKTSQMYDVIWRPFWNFAYKKVAYGCQCGNYARIVLKQPINKIHQ